MNSIEYLESRLATIAKAMESAARDLDNLKNQKVWPKEPSGGGAVITFQRTYNGHSDKCSIYDYAAIKVHNMWYVTGSRPLGAGAPYSWNDLLTLIGRDDIKNIAIAHTWKELEK